jgi:arabinose-5-phosphate isomerase
MTLPTPSHIAARVLSLEAQALERLVQALPAAFDDAVEALLDLKGRVVTTGMGKSGHVARKIAATLSSTGCPAHYVHPGEASHGDLGAVERGDILIALSWSGETSELSDIVAHARRAAVAMVSITGPDGGFLARSAAHPLRLPGVEEACRITAAPTTSTTLMMALGDALAVARLEHSGFTERDFRMRHPGGRLGARLATLGDVMHTGAALPLVQADTPAADLLVEMTEKRMGCAGVLDDEGRLIGMVTDGDLRRGLGPDFLEKRAAAVMTPAPRTLPADMLAAEALVELNSMKVTNAFILDAEKRPQGFVHIHDLLALGL